MHVDVDSYVTKDLEEGFNTYSQELPGGSVTSMHILGRATP